jgi:hypothetical protein
MSHDGNSIARGNLHMEILNGNSMGKGYFYKKIPWEGVNFT